MRPGLVVLVTTIALSLLFANQATSQEGDLIVSPPYSDVDPSNVHRDNIASLKAAGILNGTECGPDQFCPSEPLSRRTFAVWMVRVLDGDQAPTLSTPTQWEPRGLPMSRPANQNLRLLNAYPTSE